MNIKNIKKAHIIGIEGAGTSALARMLKNASIEVSGSDEGDHFYYDMLKSIGIKVAHKFDERNIPSDVDLVVYSLAFKKEINQETAFAYKNIKNVLSYGEALALLFNQEYGISICGSHGKTTVSAWLAYVLRKSGRDPKLIVGAKVPQFNGNSLLGNSDYFVLESDEYGNKLQYLKPRAVLLNNIDYDHPDFFPAEEDYNQVFIEFIKKIPKKGWLAVNFDDSYVRKIAPVNTRAKVISYAINETADYMAYDIKQLNDKQYFKVKIGSSAFEEDDLLTDTELGSFSIQLSGEHNIYNALAVIASAIELGVNLADIRIYLEEFKGTARRMEMMGKFNGAIILDDYAHHPTEIKTTLAGARQKYGNKKIRVVFHPHTFTRTRALLDDFAESFNDADEVAVLDIYGSAREKHGGVHSLDLVEKIKSKIKNQKSKIHYIATLGECEKYLRGTIRRDEIIILMGAGDVFRIGERLVV
ncbi:MAG: UDP-N-acetylmuramate--L-alanine ligase [Patescibacteria group bacterium]|nr:UDP-N-acetylmuramate--L-alanine ligase [Patescibacteria group bacterium]